MKLRLPGRHAAARAATLALAFAALVGVVTGREKPMLEAPPPKPARHEPAPAGDIVIDLAKLERRAAAAAQADPFAPRSFAPPPAPARAAPPGPPSAPPLPFAYVGRITQGGVTEVFVLRGEELISIAAGRRIDAEYRVDSISDSRIAFTYLPLKTRQSLELDEAGG